jgi:hypothetical protein
MNGLAPTALQPLTSPAMVSAKKVDQRRLASVWGFATLETIHTARHPASFDEPILDALINLETPNTQESDVNHGA